MRKIISIAAVSLLLFAPLALPQATTEDPTHPRQGSATGSKGVVVSGRPAASAAGIKYGTKSEEDGLPVGRLYSHRD